MQRGGRCFFTCGMVAVTSLLVVDCKRKRIATSATLRVLALVAILDHLGLPTSLPRLTPPRAPPALPSSPTLWLDGVDPDPSWS
jgi:hypothetical protein